LDEHKGAIAMQKSKTHFEQVPLELVKKIAKEEDSSVTTIPT
jgi:hypothetical protein